MLAEGALVIEWPERLDGLIPKERLWINLDHIEEEHRQMRLMTVNDTMSCSKAFVNPCLQDVNVTCH